MNGLKIVLLTNLNTKTNIMSLLKIITLSGKKKVRELHGSSLIKKLKMSNIVKKMWELSGMKMEH